MRRSGVHKSASVESVKTSGKTGPGPHHHHHGEKVLNKCTFRLLPSEIPLIRRLVHCLPEDVKFVQGLFAYLTDNRVSDSVKHEELKKIEY